MISYFRLILQNVTNIINRMLYKVRVLETNVSAFSQRAAILALMGKLMKVMLCTVNIMKICTYGVMEWGLNSGSVFFFELLMGIVLPNNSLTWFYIECHHGKGPIDGIVCILFFYLAYT